MSVRVQKGGLKKAQNTLRRLADQTEMEIREKHLRSFVEMAHEFFTDNIKDEEYPVAPLSPAYRKWKMEHGYNKRVLNRRGWYLRPRSRARRNRLDPLLARTPEAPA